LLLGVPAGPFGTGVPSGELWRRYAAISKPGIQRCIALKRRDADRKGYFDSIPRDKLMACVRMRVADRSVLTLIRMWLDVPVVDPGGSGGEPAKWSRSQTGTPQGGVISPLLSNLYLHWFDKVFHRSDGPAQWAGAKLVRYADDFVVLARYPGSPWLGFIEMKIETWLGLEINRDKTRVVQRSEAGESLNFLGFTLRYYDDRKGRPWRLNVSPSEKALKRERAKLHERTDHRQCFKPIPQLIEELNRHLKGWANYFSFGYPRAAFREIHSYVRYRLEHHLRRRSQRPFRPPEGVSYNDHFKSLGLVHL
jgi:RNA-directed DNA polymerase